MRNQPLCFCCLVALLIGALVAGGCTSTNSSKGAYPTLKQTRMNVDWPMTRYRNAVAAGAVTLGQQQQVNNAYNAYKAAFDAALKAANNNDQVTTPDNVKALANQLMGVLDAIAL